MSVPPARHARTSASKRTVGAGARTVEVPRAKELARGRAASPIEIAVSVGEANVAAANAAARRIGVGLRLGTDAPAIDARDEVSFAHALRVEVLAALEGSLALAPNLSERARRAFGDLGLATRDEGTLLVENEDGRISLRAPERIAVDLGEPPEARAVLLDARARDGAAAFPLPEPQLPDDAIDKALGITFGPSRSLSEPSSLRLLECFGVRTAQWRLVEDAARAATAGRAIGFPVDLRIASPDASAIDDRELGASELRTPAEVREAYRVVTKLARKRHPHARLLGAVVTRHLAALPRLAISVSSGPPALMTLRLDDPIGRRLVGPTLGPAPRTMEAAAALLTRFGGREVLPKRGTALDRALLDLLVRAGLLVDRLGGAVATIDLAPIAPSPEGEFRVVGARARVVGVDVGEASPD